jgi:hypothetical protein
MESGSWKSVGLRVGVLWRRSVDFDQRMAGWMRMGMKRCEDGLLYSISGLVIEAV